MHAMGPIHSRSVVVNQIQRGLHKIRNQDISVEHDVETANHILEAMDLNPPNEQLNAQGIVIYFMLLLGDAEARAARAYFPPAAVRMGMLGHVKKALFELEGVEEAFGILLPA